MFRKTKVPQSSHVTFCDDTIKEMDRVLSLLKGIENQLLEMAKQRQMTADISKD